MTDIFRGQAEPGKEGYGMDIKAKIEEIVEKIKNDRGIAEGFARDPAGTVEKLVGVRLPKEEIGKIADAVRAKVDLDKLGGALGGLFGKK